MNNERLKIIYVNNVQPTLLDNNEKYKKVLNLIQYIANCLIKETNNITIDCTISYIKDICLSMNIHNEAIYIGNIYVQDMFNVYLKDVTINNNGSQDINKLLTNIQTNYIVNNILGKVTVL